MGRHPGERSSEGGKGVLEGFWWKGNPASREDPHEVWRDESKPSRGKTWGLGVLVSDGLGQGLW